MKLGFVTEYAEDVVRFAADNGFDCLELQAGPESILRAWGITGRLGDVADYCHQHHIRVSSLCLANNPLGDRHIGEHAQRYFEWLIEACEVLRCDTIAASTGQNPSLSLQENLQRFAAVWSRIAQNAAAKHIKIVFENCPHGYPTGMNLAISPTFWHALFDVLPAENIGLEYDPSHLVYQFVDYLAPIPEFATRIFRVHAKDTEINASALARGGSLSDGWWEFRLPGTGQVNWFAFFARLYEAGYDGDVLIEHEDPVFGGERRFEGLLKGKEHLLQFMS